MSLQKIGNASTPDAQSLKRDILHDTLFYNIHEQEIKNAKKYVEKYKQIEEDQLINRRVSTQLNQELEKAKEKKRKIREILASQYDKQIQERKLGYVEEIKRQRGFAQAAEDRQKDYYDRRGRELMRIYRAQRTLQAMNPQSQQLSKIQPLNNQQFNRSRIRTENIQPILSQYKSYQPPTIDGQKNFHNQAIRMQKQKDEKIVAQSIPQSVGQSRISTTHANKSRPHLMQPYKQYLVQQIQRKRQQKEQQIRNRLEIEKQMSKHNYNLLEREKEQIREIQRKQKQIYKRGLDEQVAQKHYLRRNF